MSDPTAVGHLNPRAGLSLTPEAPSLRHIHTDITSCTWSTCHVFSRGNVSFSFGKIVILFLEEEHSRKKSFTSKYFSRCQIPTPRTLEHMLCSVLSQTSEDEGDGEGRPGDCHPRWSAAQAYLVRAVSWLHVYKQVRCRADASVLAAPVQSGSETSLSSHSLHWLILFLLVDFVVVRTHNMRSPLLIHF